MSTPYCLLASIVEKYNLRSYRILIHPRLRLERNSSVSTFYQLSWLTLFLPAATIFIKPIWAVASNFTATEVTLARLQQGTLSTIFMATPDIGTRKLGQALPAYLVHVAVCDQCLHFPVQHKFHRTGNTRLIGEPLPRSNYPRKAVV